MFEPDFTIPNTLGVDSFATQGCFIRSTHELQQAIQLAAERNCQLNVLGEGSNIIPAPLVPRTVGVMQISGIEPVDETGSQTTLLIGAGEQWHKVVMYTLSQGWYGLENLALIPGSVGAAPVQNIGAYGRELASFIDAVYAIDAQGKEHCLTQTECEFAYRDSIFKRRKDLSITHVRLRLSKRANLEMSYDDLKARVLEIAGRSVPTPETVAQAVMQIRQEKLPDPAKIPNVGSFFKNPSIPTEQLTQLLEVVPHARYFTMPGESVKLSAAQLIDHAGWKNKPGDGVACWSNQALVLVNTGTTSSLPVLSYARAIQQDIQSRYQVELELEPSVFD